MAFTPKRRTLTPLTKDTSKKATSVKQKIENFIWRNPYKWFNLTEISEVIALVPTNKIVDHLITLINEAKVIKGVNKRTGITYYTANNGEYKENDLNPTVSYIYDTLKEHFAITEKPAKEFILLRIFYLADLPTFYKAIDRLLEDEIITRHEVKGRFIYKPYKVKD